MSHRRADSGRDGAREPEGAATVLDCSMLSWLAIANEAGPSIRRRYGASRTDRMTSRSGRAASLRRSVAIAGHVPAVPGHASCSSVREGRDSRGYTSLARILLIRARTERSEAGSPTGAPRHDTTEPPGQTFRPPHGHPKDGKDRARVAAVPRAELLLVLPLRVRRGLRRPRMQPLARNDAVVRLLQARVRGAHERSQVGVGRACGRC
jgi:hypothetical protein